MSSLFSIIKNLCNALLLRLGLRRADSPAPVMAAAGPDRPHGTTGRLDVPTLLLNEDSHMVLIVDYDFEDIPSWVEWDARMKKLSVVQMGGAAAELALGIPAGLNASFETMQRLMLVTGRFERRNGHYVSFIVRT